MNIYIYRNNQYVEVTDYIDGNVKLTERIDKALDTGEFSIITNQWTTNIPPFTLCKISDGGADTIYFCSSKCSKILSKGYDADQGWTYYHTVSLIEPIKIFECYLVGSKSFSVIPDEPNYNKDSDWIDILCWLMASKYNIAINPSPRIATKFTDGHDFIFGKGSSLSDCLFEIMERYNCYPKVTNAYISIGRLHFTLDYFDFMEEADEETFTQTEMEEQDQSVDDYCSVMETELEKATDRNTLNTVYLSCRTKEDYISTDSACLLLPADIDSVKWAMSKQWCYNALWVKIKRSALSNSDIISSIDNLTDIYNTGWTGGNAPYITYLQSKFINQQDYDDFHDWCEEVLEEMYEGDPSSVDQMTIFFRYYDDEYIYGFIVERIVGITDEDYESQQFYPFQCLEKNQWDLLAATQKPYSAYFTHGSNAIEGLYNFYHDQFWEKLIYSEEGPALRVKTANLWLTEYSFERFNAENKREINSNITVSRDFQYIPEYVTDDNPLNRIYKIEYYPICSVKIEQNKSFDNGSSKLSRSYENGGNSVDFDLLIPSIKKAVDMSGLKITTISSRENHEIGSLTQFGYVIQKSIVYRLSSNNQIIKECLYYCCDNREQIAMAIGLKTQYESTRNPLTNIINRFIFVSHSVSGNLPILDGLYLKIGCSDDDINWKYRYVPLTVLKESNNEVYLVFQAEDNYSIMSQFGTGFTAYDNLKGTIEASKQLVRTQLTADDDRSKVTLHYYVPIDYSNKNNVGRYYKYSVGTLLSGELTTQDQYDNLPLNDGTYWNERISLNNGNSILTMKDSRERLIFTIKLEVSE